MSTTVSKHQNLIGGEWVDASSGETMEVLNPSTGEVIAEVPRASAEDVDRAVQAAKKALVEWLETTPAERAELLLKLAFEEEIRFPADAATAALAAQLGAHGSVEKGDEHYRFRPQPGYKLSSFYSLTESRGLPARHFTSQRPTLEAVFLHLTGRNLRE